MNRFAAFTQHALLGMLFIVGFYHFILFAIRRADRVGLILFFVTAMALRPFSMGWRNTSQAYLGVLTVLPFYPRLNISLCHVS